MRRLFVFAGAWLQGLLSARAAASLLSSFGTLWLVTEITVFLFGPTGFPHWLQDHWWLFALIGIAIALFSCRPRMRVAQKLNGRDVTVEIAIGDVFSLDGALIIGSNTTFDTKISATLISGNSVQGQFTTRYFSDEAKLDIEIADGLDTSKAEHLLGKRQGKSDRYPIGTVVRLNPKGRTAYFVAIADINEHGVAEGSFQKLQVALAELWVFVGSRGLKERLVMPVLGTGFSRLPQTREQIAREIIRSFVAACSERVLADKLTIVISPDDVAAHRISIDELGSFLQHACLYTEFSRGSGNEIGAPA